MKYFLLVCIASTTSLVCKEPEHKSSQDWKKERDEHYDKAKSSGIETVIDIAGTTAGIVKKDIPITIIEGSRTIKHGRETYSEIKKGRECNKEYRKATKIERDVERQIEAQESTNNYQGESSFCDTARGQ